MPATNSVLSGVDLTKGLLATFTSFFMKDTVTNPALPNICDLGMPTTGRYEIYSIPKTAPYPARWRQGEGVPTEGFDYYSHQVNNVRYGRRIIWDVDDREDGQTQSLFPQAQHLGTHFKVLPEIFAFEYINGSASFLDGLINAPDGAALYSATDGAGAARFGVTGGNIISGSGVASGDAVRTDFWKAVGTMKQFQDTKGQPYYMGGELDQGFTVVYSSLYEQVFAEAFKQELTSLIVAGSAGGHVGTGTAVAAAGGLSNTTVTKKITLWSTPRLTDVDWYIFANDAPFKPLFMQMRLQATGTYATKENSDLARDIDVEYIQFKHRSGFAPAIPIGTCKINN